jgi:hypothetical protein
MTGKARRKACGVLMRTPEGRWRRRLACVFGLVAILPYLLASTAWASHARQATAPGLGVGLWVVCTESGAIVADSRGAPVRGADRGPDCACCLLLTFGVLHAPDSFDPASQPPARAAVALTYRDADSSSSPRHVRAGASPRGPPVA